MADHSNVCGQLRIAASLIDSAMTHQLGQPDGAMLLCELGRAYLSLTSAQQLAHKKCQVATRRPSWQPEPPSELVIRWITREIT
jgi:hypothetical protein